MTHGTLTLQGDVYSLNSAPHVRLVAQRLFLTARRGGASLNIKRTPDVTESLLWLLDRWPHEMSEGLRLAMEQRVRSNVEQRELAAGIMDGTIAAPLPAAWNPEFPLRDYQRQAVALAAINGALLIGDDLGLGKTATAIGIMAERGGNSIVICDRHLQTQWAAQVAQFCPSLRTHIVKQRKEYSMPDHEVTICSYSKLASVADRGGWNTVIYDEVQALRHDGTGKSDAAHRLADSASCRIGLSATPVYNYAGEIYNVMDALSPGTLGTRAEFFREWGVSGHDYKMKVADPEALGAWLRGQNVYIRRRRCDVGRELPPINWINHIVEHDERVIDRLRAQANELAERVLSGGFHERGESARQLDILLRQTTGIAKAPFVADFVAQLVENGESVLLAGWHREVYGIWHREFERREIPFVMFTGSESEARKLAAQHAFQNGDARVMIMSLRSGAGLDGLQKASRTVVIGELDWSPQVIRQLVGRLCRDGQAEQVTVFTMMADAGADPIMSSTLGQKWESSTKLTDPDLVRAEPADVPDNRVSELARAWLSHARLAVA